MPAPKVAGKKHKKQLTVYDENGNWTTHQHQDSLRQMENNMFVKYYRDTQKITGGDAEAFDKFVETMRTPLETTIWINDCDPLAPSISAYLSSLGDELATPIPWFPNPGMGWRVHCDKVAFRKDERFKQLRQFLINQTAMGTVSRQEEVSMIPPFLLDIKPTDACLDMCASPGSKTAQMLVELGRQKKTPDAMFPFDYLSDGFIMANELDTRRANMLVHQVKRMQPLFPFALFTNHDARYFPELNAVPTAGTTADPAPRKFDKILCDVVCSGDGTMRKSPFIFKVWTPKEAMNLQKTQIQIALRACHLLKVGGRLVYSTCSLNPIENEAAVSQIIKRTGGSMKLVDARSLLPNLSCAPGLTTWQVTDNKGNVVERTVEEGGAHDALFPLEDPPADMDLTKCMRLMPDHCSGGGFFVAVLDKVAEWELTKKEDVTGENVTKKRRAEKPPTPSPEGDAEKEATAEDAVPTTAVEGEGSPKAAKPPKVSPQYVSPSSEMLDCIPKFYKLTTFPLENLVVRAPNGERELRADPTANVSFVSNEVLRILKGKSDKVCVVSAGLRSLAYENLTSGWRIVYEAIPAFERFLVKYSDRVVTVPKSLLVDLLVGGKLKQMLLPNITDTTIRTKIEALEMGAILFRVSTTECIDETAVTVAAMGLRARSRIQLLVDHEEIVGLKHRLGVTDEEVAAADVRYKALLESDKVLRAAAEAETN